MSELQQPIIVSTFRQRLRAFVFGFLMLGSGLAVILLIIMTTIVIAHFPGDARYPADCAIVFGSAVQRGREAGPGIRRRVDTAVRLWKEGSIQRIILTGGLGEGNELSEAQVMFNEALERGVPSRVLTMERAAVNTWQNIAYTKALLDGCSSTVAISDRYHLARIRFIAWGQGVPLMVQPAWSTANILFEVRAILREALAIIYYALQMMITPLHNVPESTSAVQIMWTVNIASYKMHYTKLYVFPTLV